MAVPVAPVTTWVPFLFDLSGKLVKQLFKGQVNGWHDVVWDGTGANQESLPAGVYVCKTNEHVMKLMKVE